jgi:hypothetical protein
MDAQRLDTLAKAVGRWTTRRSVVAFVVGMGLAARTPGVTMARQKNTKAKNKKKKCKQFLPQTQCMACPPFITHPCHWRISVRCPTQPDGTICTEDGGTACCFGRCRNLQTDVDHCGACRNACAEGQTCQAGACVP